VPYPDVARWVNAATVNGGKTATASSRAGLKPVQPGQGLKEDFVHPLTFSNVSNARNFDTHFCLAVLKRCL
jgi:hypothetical protein